MGSSTGVVFAHIHRGLSINDGTVPKQGDIVGIAGGDGNPRHVALPDYGKKRAGRTDDGDLTRRADAEIESTQHSAESGWKLSDVINHEPRCVHGLCPVAGMIQQCAEPKQEIGGHRVSGRCRIVEVLLGARDERFMVSRREKETALVRIPELIDHPFNKLDRTFQPARVEGELVEGQEPVGKIGVVLQIAVETRPTRP